MKIFLIFLFVFFVSCTSNVTYKTKVQRDHEPTENSRIEAKGVIYHYNTSFYANKFHGKATSSGEKYNMYAYTCAHKKLPFGTKLKVTNEDNGKSVVVRVNDRGPFVEGRDLDLSYAAAKKIGLIPYGVKILKVQIIDQN